MICLITTSMSSIFFYRMVFVLEREDSSCFIIPYCTPNYRMHKYVRNTCTISHVSHLSIVDNQFQLSTGSLGQLLNNVTRLHHLHLEIAHEPLNDRDRFQDDLLAVVENVLLNNKNTLESLTLNTCSVRTMETIRTLPKLKVIVLTITDIFVVASYGPNRATGSWPSLEAFVVKLRCFEPVRPQFVEAFLDHQFPVLTSASIIGSPPCSCVHDFLSIHDELERVSIVTPEEHSPFPLPYEFVLPKMPNVVELSFTSRHYSHFNTVIQSSVESLLLYDEELPLVPYLPHHKEFVDKIGRSHAFPNLQHIFLRSTIDSSFEMCFTVSQN